MKKKYDSKSNNSKLDGEDELTVKQLVDGLEKLDQWNPVSTPDLQWFQQNVELEKKRLRKKLWKDLLIFISVAVALLTVLVAFVYREPIIFVYFQLVGIILLPLVINKTRKKVSNE